MRRCSTSVALSLVGFIAFSTVYIYIKGLEEERNARASVVLEKLSTSTKFIPMKVGQDPNPEIDQRREFIKSMMRDAWDSYVKYAWGDNELQPVSQRGRSGGAESLFGDSKMGTTIIDSLDTLYLMGMTEEFEKGRDWVAKWFSFKKAQDRVSLFETTIRVLGGLLSAHALTKDPLFANLAIDVGKRLLPAFKTKSGIPSARVNPATGEIEHGGSIALAELGTLHLEFVQLSKISGDPIFAQKVLKIQRVMDKLKKSKGLYYSSVRTNTGKFEGDHVTMGGGADSFYEYLLKAYIQTGDLTARKMYDDAMDAFFANDLVRTTKQNHLLYIAEKQYGQIDDKGSHLECFAGGMFALGSRTDPRAPNQSKKDRDLEIGINLTNTCHESYIRTATRIGPEEFSFRKNIELMATNPSYILRPEVIESYFVLYRLTGDSKYRDWGWDAAQAIQKYCKAGPGKGYSGIRNVNDEDPHQDDVQQTFFLAETLKYLYLLFSASDFISLDEWVFNTEAHPLPIIRNNNNV